MASPAPLPRELDTAEPYRPPVAGLESAVAGDADAPRPAIAADTATGFDGACRLDDWGLIVAQGADAASFLHGQLTQDVSNLPQGRARLAGYCSAKGRLLASFVMWRDVSGVSGSGAALASVAATGRPEGDSAAPAAAPTPEPILLACSADLLAATLKRLSMFVLRAKCRLHDATASVALYGLAGVAADAWVREHAGLGSEGPISAWTVWPAGQASAIRLPDGAPDAGQTPRWLLVGPATMAAPPLPALDPAAWRALEVQSGVARVTAATADHFVPQMVNLELTGGVNFQKGCYPGQEVVARSQYRGTLKRRMVLMAASAAIQPGQEVFHDSDPGQPAGEVVLSSPVPHQGLQSPHDHGTGTDATSTATGEITEQLAAQPIPHLALVSLKTELLSVEGLFRADGAVLLPRALPYEVPNQPA